jgi:hypothetical protein
MSATVLAALITGIVALIGIASTAYFTITKARREVEEARRNEAAAYLMLISTTISRMREQLADERLPDEARIPHKDGKILLGLLEGYKDYLQPYLGEKTLDELGKVLHRVDEKASILDGRLYSGDKPEPEYLGNVLADMQRVEGHVEVLAARISPTKSFAE